MCVGGGGWGGRGAMLYNIDKTPVGLGEAHMILCRRDTCWFEKLQSVSDHFKASHLGDGEKVRSIWALV